jgi:hypothetical protein
MTTFVDAEVITIERPDVMGMIAQSPTDIYVLNQQTVGPNFDPGQFRPGQKVRIFFSGLNPGDDQPQITGVTSLS